MQRPSTSSSKEAVHEKPAPAPRHSKLSVCPILILRGTFHLLSLVPH
jgi:hypothetical protein